MNIQQEWKQQSKGPDFITGYETLIDKYMKLKWKFFS